MRKYKWWKILLGFVIAVACVGVALKTVDTLEVARVKREAHKIYPPKKDWVKLIVLDHPFDQSKRSQEKPKPQKPSAPPQSAPETPSQTSQSFVEPQTNNSSTTNANVPTQASQAQEQAPVEQQTTQQSVDQTPPTQTVYANDGSNQGATPAEIAICRQLLVDYNVPDTYTNEEIATKLVGSRETNIPFVTFVISTQK